MIDDGGIVAYRAGVCEQSIVGSLQWMAELLCVRDRSWFLCREWPSCFACTIDRGFVAANGRAALLARSIVGLLLRMAEVWLRDPR